MNAPVDVLAVLAFAVGKEGSKPPPSPDRFDDALAAVAELVEAVCGELVELERRHKLGCIRREEVVTMNRLRAALVRVKGGAA